VAQAGTRTIAVGTGGPWAEQTLTWNTAPVSGAAAPAVTAPIFASDQGSSVTVDITSLVQAWVNDSQTTLGLTLRGQENPLTSPPMELEVVLVGGPQAPQDPPGRQRLWA
jgi:hypothetical protein